MVDVRGEDSVVASTVAALMSFQAGVTGSGSSFPATANKRAKASAAVKSLIYPKRHLLNGGRGAIW